MKIRYEIIGEGQKFIFLSEIKNDITELNRDCTKEIPYKLRRGGGRQ